jgi:plastocyanin
MSTTLLLTMVLSAGQVDGGYYVSSGTYWSPAYDAGFDPYWSSTPFPRAYYTGYRYRTYSYPVYSYPSYGYSSYSYPTFSSGTQTYVGTSGPCDVPVVSGSSGDYEEHSAARPDLGADHIVRMTDRGKFEPAQLKINVGDTVMWRNESGKTHSVTADPDKAANPAHVVLPEGAEKFDSGEIAPDQEFSQTFSKPGIYHYICGPHEHMGMVGTIIVMDPNAEESSSHEHSTSEPPAPASDSGSSY